MNSCGFMHGVGMHDNSLVVHENSWGALGHKNSCSSHAAGVQGGTKAPSMSTRVGVRRSAVEKLASPQQTSSKLHVEVWEGLLSNQGLRFSQEEEIVSGCAVSGARPSCLDDSPEPPGPGRIIRNMLGWSQLEKTVRSGVWLFRGALRGENLFSSLAVLQETGLRRGRTTQRGRSLLIPRVLVRTRTGEAPLSGHRLVSGVGHCFLMKPWCAEGDVPTAANLNLYRGWKSCVGWHCDDEPLFGKCGDAKLIVSVSFGSSALSGGGVSPVRMMKVTCAGLAMVTSLSWMANARTSSFIARAPVGIWNGLTLRSVGSNNMLSPVLFLRQEWHVVCQRVRRVHQFLGNWVVVSSFGVLCIWGVLVLLVSLLCTRLGLLWCAFYWTRPLGGGPWVYYLCNLWEEYLKVHKTPNECFGKFMVCYVWKPYMLALAGQPSLHGYDACMVYSNKGALRRNCRLKQCKTSFSPSWFFFLFSRNPTGRFWGLIFWHFWAGRARHPGPPSQPRHVSLEFHNVGGWLTHGDIALDAGLDFLAVAEHRLIPARVRSEWRLKGKGLSSIWAPASQDSSHLVMLVFASLVCVVLPLLCLLLLLLSLSLSLIADVLSGVCFLLPLVGFFTFVFFIVIRVLILILSSLL